MALNPQIGKKSKSIYIIGSITIGIIAVLAVYFILIVTGVISAAPIRIEITSASRTAEYNGTEITEDGWELTSGSLKDGHALRVSVVGTQTDAGESRNYFTVSVVDERGYDVSDSYDIAKNYGTLAVLPRPIVVQSGSAEKYYDGTPLTESSCAITDGSLVGGHEIEFFVNGTLTASGKADNKFIARISDGEKDVTHNYKLDYLYGTLYVHGEMLHIKTGSATKTYDGTPLTNPEYTFVSGVLDDGDELTVTVLGSQTEVGSSDNIAAIAVRSSSGELVTDKYEPMFDYGTLTVNPLSVIIETRPAYKVYDGKPLVSNAWRVVTEGTAASDVWFASGRTQTVGDYVVSARVAGSQTDVGMSENSVIGVTVTKGGVDVSAEFEVEYRPGMLTVVTRNITVQSATASKDYDGKPLTCNEYKVVSITQVAEGQELKVAVTGTITFGGVVPNTIAEVLVFDNGEDVTRNYSIKYQEGQLAIIGGPPSGEQKPEVSDVGNMDDNGELAGDDEDDEDEEPYTVMRIKSDTTGKVYLRRISFGDYTHTGFTTATPFSQTISGEVFTGTAQYGMTYLTGIALSSVRREYGRLDVELLRTTQTFLPDYLSMAELGYNIQSSDVQYVGDKTEYAVYYYSYDYISDGGRALSSVDLGAYTTLESVYRTFVYKNYLDVPQDTLEYLSGIIQEQGFDKLGTADMIAAVAGYVQNCATYKRKYNPELDKEYDMVVAFLDKYKEGLCRHYAASATLIYRALGLPARYTTGYVGDAVAGEWVELDQYQAHAWVEVYLDGVGWIQLEVTGGDGGFGGDGGSDKSGIGNPDSEDRLYVKPFDVYLNYKDFNGTPLTYTHSTLQGLTRLTDSGYAYTFTVSGEQREIGIGKSTIDSLVILNPFGEDVTNNFNIVLATGKLHIYMQEITLRTGSVESAYTGNILRTESDAWSCDGTLLKGHKIGSVKLTGARVAVGRSNNTYEMNIVDGDGNDVTYMYKVNSDYGVIRVTARALDIVADSAEAYANEPDTLPLSCGTYTIAEGGDGLAEGHVLVVEIEGVQSSVGRCENVIVSVTVTDESGNDVTDGYHITTKNGTLTVLPRRRSAREGD